ncbi:MAG: CHAT domain-containing protein [Acidobacteria bacterium]|nr:CHAT domain-containing protein [Acidobacteriota bacterium]
MILSIRASSLRALSSPDAVVTGERACDILRRVAPEGFQLASCLNTLAIARFEGGDHDGALSDFKRSLAIRERLAPGGAESGLAFMNLATMIRFAGGDLVEAEQMARKAVTLYQGLERIVPLERLRSLVRWTGRLYLETELLCQLVDLIESRPLESLSDAARQGIRWWEGNIVGRLGPHFARLGFPEEALEATERARGRAFLAARRARAGAQGESSARTAQIKATRNRYDAAQRALLGLDANSQGSAADGYRAELFRLRLELESLEARAQVPRQGFRPLTVTEIREGLGQGTLALVVVTGGEAGLEGFTVVLAVRHGEPVRSIVLPHGSQTLWPKVNAYRRLVSRTIAGAPGPELLRAGEELSCLLLGPFRDLLSDARRLVVSVDQMVAPLPFEALVVDRGEIGPVFLAERIPISYTSSLTAFLEAPPKAGATDLALWSVGDPATTSPVNALPGARVEAQTVADFHPGPAHVLIGERATEEAVKSIPPTAGTLHFACHATVDPEHPEDSALLLAQPAPGSPENGRLRGWEIVNELSLNADLVVLSACESSGAVNTPTEGPLGLAYAFQVAGARRVLAARWKVPDEVAVRFMEAFYSARARGLAADRCLQEAQVALRSNPETAHPYFWAGFVLHGDGR